MRKMAKNTALRLAEKTKEMSTLSTNTTNTTGTNLRGKTTATSTNGPSSQSIYAKNRATNSTGNNTNNTGLQGGDAIKLPKVINSSNKNIDAIKKPDNNAFRITNSRDRGRIQL